MNGSNRSDDQNITTKLSRDMIVRSLQKMYKHLMIKTNDFVAAKGKMQ